MVAEIDLGEFQTEEDTRGFDVPKAGTYHLAVVDVDDSKENVDALKVTFQILAGTVDGQAGRQFTDTFWTPSSAAKDGGKFANKRQVRLALATGLINPAAFGSRVSIDWDDLRGRQLVAKVVATKWTDKNGNGREGAETDGLNLYAVGATEVAAVPKDAEALKLLEEAAQAATGQTTTAQASGGQSAGKKSDPYADL